MTTRVKICCISSTEEAKIAIDFGASALGLVANMPSGPGVISDELKEGTYQIIKNALPAIKIVQVIHVIDEKTIDEAIRTSEYVDASLLDSGNPNLKVKELGGTGRVHNWKFSRKIVEQSKVPVFLAGGLTSKNVRQAIDQVQPFGVDLCSGVRTNKKLDPEKLEQFFNNVLK